MSNQTYACLVRNVRAHIAQYMEGKAMSPRTFNLSVGRSEFDQDYLDEWDSQMQKVRKNIFSSIA